MRHAHGTQVVLAVLAALLARPAPGDGGPYHFLGDASRYQTFSPGPVSGPIVETWRFRCGGVFASPLVVQEVVVFGSRDGYLYAVNRASGHRIWRCSVSIPGLEPAAPTDERRWRYQPLTEQGLLATCAADGSTVYVGGLAGDFVAVNLADGKRRWAFAAGGPISSSAVLLPDRVIFGTRNGEMAALDPASGRLLWRKPFAGPINSSPAFADGRLVVGTAAGLVAINPANGDTLWSVATESFKRVDSTPVMVKGVVYAASWEGTVVAVAADSGKALWERPISRLPIFAAPAIGHDSVYVVTTTGVLVALEASTGAPRWHAALYRGCYATPLVCGPLVLLATSGAALQLFDGATGEPRGQMQRGLRGYLHGTPSLVGGSLYLSLDNRTSDGSVVCLGPPATSTAAPANDALVPTWEFAALACRELGLLKQAATPGTDWAAALVAAGAELGGDAAAHQRLASLRLMWSYGWQHNRRPLTRGPLAAFYYKLFWEPNPFGVELPAAAPVRPSDRIPYWGQQGLPLVIGMGLIDLIDGRFEERRPVTYAELQKSFARAKELLAKRRHDRPLDEIGR